MSVGCFFTTISLAVIKDIPKELAMIKSKENYMIPFVEKMCSVDSAKKGKDIHISVYSY